MRRSVVVALVAGALLAGATAGFLLAPEGADPKRSGQPADQGQTWTCSMHPHIRVPAPGKCPICGMPLVPVAGEPSTAGRAPSMTLSDAAIAMAGVETTPVARRELAKVIRAVGRIEPNETALAKVTIRVEGWVEKLYLDATGVPVKAGEEMLQIYSPELYSAQRELLIAVQSNAGEGIVNAARSRLERWNMSPGQIDEVLRRKEPFEFVTIHSPATGIVLTKNVVRGEHVERGYTLYEIANLESVWVHIDIYEYEISWVRPGETVKVVAEAFPGREFPGMVTFVSPVLNEQTRTVRVRVSLPNADGGLKPGMFVSATLLVRLLESGNPAPTPVAGKWQCPMHPEVIEDTAGKCQACGMPLLKVPGGDRPPTADDLRVLAVPATAVLDAGTRKLVYVQRGPGLFEQAEPILGPRAGEWFPVVSGLNEGDLAVTRGGFLIDSQFQIRGLPSLLSPGGGAAPNALEHGRPPPGETHRGSGHEGSDHGK